MICLLVIENYNLKSCLNRFCCQLQFILIKYICVKGKIIEYIDTCKERLNYSQVVIQQYKACSTDHKEK